MKLTAHALSRSDFSAIGKVAAVTALVLVFGVKPARADLTFQNVINPGDVTFNQELGINNNGTIAGYFGSGMAGHPNQGYTTNPPYTSFTPENYPGSVQTQVTGINDVGTTVGFYSLTNMGVGMDSNFGFVDVGGTFTAVNNPGTSTTPPVFNQLLGVNNSNVAVGFYTDAANVTHGYTYNIGAATFSANIDDPLANGSTTAAAINNSGEIAGFYMDAAGNTDGFLDIGGKFTTVDFPGAMDTSLLGINDNGLAVGFDMYASGQMFGLVCNTTSLGCQQFSDPSGVGTTTFNGINNKNQIVGFYVNPASGDTIGLVTSSYTPEPSFFGLLAAGLVCLGGVARSRRRAS